MSASRHPYHFLLLALGAVSVLTTGASADNWTQPTSWTQPTPEELKMTSEPAAPGAAAIFLFIEQIDDNRSNVRTLYVRLKVLTEEGKENADFEIPYEGGQYKISIEGRTIHSDGTIIPFTGKPYEKMLEKTKKLKHKAKVFTLPDVQVGSILEYRFSVQNEDKTLVVAPAWYIQQSLYVRKAHYEFIPTEVDYGHGGMKRGVAAYTASLPKGVAVQLTPNDFGHFLTIGYEINVENIAPIPDEEYMPPIDSMRYHVFFYYTSVKSTDEYWKMVVGKPWSQDVDKFIASNKLSGIVSQIVAPSDSPQDKVRKIYNAVMKLDNTSLTRKHSGREDKAEGIKIRTAADIWNAKRGYNDEIADLFVGLVRAAGLKAYVARVTNRDSSTFVENYLNMGQLDDDIAIVELDGKDEVFDPGQRYCEFGQLHWKHTTTMGLRQTDHGPELVETAAPGYKSTSISRNADLHIEPDGRVHGIIRITMTGSEALAWRQRALSTDEDEIKKELEKTIHDEVPAGVEVKTNHFLALDEYDKTVMAVLDVSGSMGTATSKRIFMPATFFEAGSKPLFVHEKRTVPIDLEYPYQVQDSVTLHLPKNFTVESIPKDAQIPLPKDTAYQATFKQGPDTLEAKRLFILATTIYGVEDYPAVKDFFQKVNAKDQEQAVLQPAAAVAPIGGAQ